MHNAVDRDLPNQHVLPDAFPRRIPTFERIVFAGKGAFDVGVLGSERDL